MPAFVCPAEEHDEAPGSQFQGLHYGDEPGQIQGIEGYVAMLCEQENGVNLSNLQAIKTWMDIDDLMDAVDMRWHQMSWEEAARRQAAVPPR